jgi:hypothetical protein
MKLLKITLPLLASSASLVTMLAIANSATAETITNSSNNPQFIEIVRQPSSQPNRNYTVNRLTKDELVSPLSEDALLNDDKIGDAAIKKYGCDCAGCRRAIAQMFR